MNKAQPLLEEREKAIRNSSALVFRLGEMSLQAEIHEERVHIYTFNPTHAEALKFARWLIDMLEVKP